MPPHQLKLKAHLPVILLRNIDFGQSLCNGSRLVVKRFYKYLIEAEIAFGDNKGQTVYLTKMPLEPTDIALPFSIRRVQFPIKPAFAFTINRAQGQTLDKVLLWLPTPVFSHGQLYVALSRVRNPSDIKIALDYGEKSSFTRNVVYDEIYSI